ncbi:MAG: 50S ribosomal protein L9, partial [Lentisphaeria bacterium]|nr:50S ribosomal protein L9 [Lentisphaeria bacterium]
MANNVKLILLQDVENLGLAGSEVTVAPGYARNYLIPQGLAAKATPGILRVLAANKEKIEAKRRDELVAAQATAAKLMETVIEIAMQASDDNQLFGSVTARNVADA